MDQVDQYRTEESRVGTNEIVIIDKTRRQYVKVPEDKNRKDKQCEIIGIIPIVTTAANALYAQKLIEVAQDGVTDYEPIKDVTTLAYDDGTKTNQIKSDLSGVAIISQRINNEKTEDDNKDDFFDSLAIDADGFFPPITLQADGGFDRENMRKIGLVVVQAYLDASEGNKISFQILESFVGSLERGSKNPNTNADTFIDTVVNENSEYVNLFSNCVPTEAMKDAFNKNVDILVIPHDDAKVGMLGFFKDMCQKDIDISESILKGMDIMFDKVSDINERELDIVVDGGVSNIAQYIRTVCGGRGKYEPASPEAAVWKCRKDSDVKMWKTVIQKLDNFCKNVRRDCMFIADGPRPFCLQGQRKIIRPSKPTNSIESDILPFMKYLTGINTSYGAGYCNWFQVTDEFSGDYFWCPPSIKICGSYIFTDLNYNYWDAPAGLTRGRISALDLAFSPTNKQAGQIYTKNWNYCTNYPRDGIVIDGQKTLQTKPTALDRVNVRRLCLRLERATYNVLRYMLFEGNTAYNRQRMVDLLTPYFNEVKLGGGLYDYTIKCDETNNTAVTIDNNELHAQIGIKPVKAIEFIMVDFVILPSGGSWTEL
jgi:Phage tail sheath protein FI